MNLPDHLDERTSRLGPPPRTTGARVVYWMRTAVRGHDNPALDVAMAVAEATGHPLLVYHAVSERYPYASDRHHTFILEGARDVAAELAERGVSYALHVERPGHRGPHLRTLAADAVLVVTEDMPVAPLLGWTRRLAEEHPVWVVDTACVVPMPLVGRALDRAFAFRKATAPLRHDRLDRVWPERTVPPGAAHDGPLPFEPVDAASMDTPALVAACEIDHAVGPVPHTRGGSRAGYARWNAFCGRPLKAYAARRNDAADAESVSRMSPYLHMGMVSPLRIAREASAMPGKGPAKFLDELLIWREMAYAYCRHEPRHGTVDALPAWARATLRRHETDPREALPSWETVARAATGDALWDAAQTSLLVHGELHNNVRMTWGKAMLGWTPDAAAALDRLLDLNHRYALDGRDPNSYAGILWCLGGLDRPFRPERPVLGEVRPRPTDKHARRLDLDAYRAHVHRPLRADGPRIAVVGGGIAGMAAARVLGDHGHEVVVFDKGRGPGGRMSTRRHAVGHHDHGAQYVTARDPRFRRYVHAWAHDGVVAAWEGRFASIDEHGVHTDVPSTPRWVGVPKMNAVVKHLAQDVDARFGVRVGAVARRDDGWWLADEDGEDLGRFDAVVVAVPAPQAAPLLEEAPALADAAARVGVEPCWAAMVTCFSPVDLPYDGAKVRAGPLAWVARDSSKPGRPDDVERWVLHASPAWTREHLEDDREAVASALAAAFEQLGGPTPDEVVAHRWRYARVTDPVATTWDPRGLVVCGDGVAGGRVEDAFLSGHAAAGRLLGWLSAEAEAPAPTQPALFG